MNDPTLCCNLEIVELYLTNSLDGERAAAFESHLDECDECCNLLIDQAAEDEWWESARESLSSHEEINDELTGQRERLGKASLALLGATDDPRMLGRFGGYEIAGVVGFGGMGIVLKGFDQALNRYVAIKVLAPHLATSVAARRRFAREAQAAAAIMHDNVIAIHGVSECDDLPFLVMPYVRGESLQKRLDRCGTLSQEEVLRIALQTAAGLAAAHAQGLVHRDIKPANILLPENVERVKITDFGLARAADDASLTRSGVIAGTPQFMSPEQARGDAVDHRSDLFSLGSVMYAMLVGRPPFCAESSYGVLRRIGDCDVRPVIESKADAPDWLSNVVGKLHAQDRDDRYQNAEEVVEILEQCLAHVQNSDEVLPLSLRQKHDDTEEASPRLRSIVVVTAACLFLAMVWAIASFMNPGQSSSDPAGKASAPKVELPTTNGSNDEPVFVKPTDINWDDGSTSTMNDIDDAIESLKASSPYDLNQDTLLTPTD